MSHVPIRQILTTLLLLTILLTGFVLLSEQLNPTSLSAYPPHNPYPDPYPDPDVTPVPPPPDTTTACDPALVKAGQLGVLVEQLRDVLEAELALDLIYLNNPDEAQAAALSLGYPNYQAFKLAVLAYVPLQAKYEPCVEHTRFNNRLHLPITFHTRSLKMGIGWSSSHLYPDDHEALNISWFHNWSYQTNGGDTSSPILSREEFSRIGIEYVPFVWCLTTVRQGGTVIEFLDGPQTSKYPWPTNGIPDSIERVLTSTDMPAPDGNGISPYDGYLLILNEPFIAGFQCGEQLRDDPEWIARAYIEIRHYFPHAKLIGPQIKAEEPEDLDKLAAWRQAVYDLTCDPTNYPHYPDITCGYPDMEGYAIHPYFYILGNTSNLWDGDRTMVEDLQELLEDWQVVDGRTEPYELWVTEFGYCDSWDNYLDQLENFVTWMEAQSFVTRYAYYANRTIPANVYTVASGEDGAGCTDDRFSDPNDNRFLYQRFYEEICQELFPNDIPQDQVRKCRNALKATTNWGTVSRNAYDTFINSMTVGGSIDQTLKPQGELYRDLPNP